MIKIVYDKDSHRVCAGKILKGGKFGADYNEVSSDAISAVFQYILDVKTDGDGSQIIEYLKYNISIHIDKITPP